jgi:hypothetical protein
VVGEAGRWWLFSGIPISVSAILLACVVRHGSIRGISERALPYVTLGVMAVLISGGRELYHRCPKRLIVPLGIAGWIIASSVLLWYYWFGPGAFGR